MFPTRGPASSSVLTAAGSWMVPAWGTSNPCMGFIFSDPVMHFREQELFLRKKALDFFVGFFPFGYVLQDAMSLLEVAVRGNQTELQSGRMPSFFLNGRQKRSHQNIAIVGMDEIDEGSSGAFQRVDYVRYIFGQKLVCILAFLGLSVCVKQLESHLDRRIENSDRRILHDIAVRCYFFGLFDDFGFGMRRKE
jgi:hypothetical protein